MKTARDQFKEYKIKCKVILQKQKDQITAAQAEMKELERYRDEVSKLKEQMSSLSSENWAQKYEQIEQKLAGQTKDLQNKKLEIADIRKKLLLKEREMNVIQEEFEREKDEIRNEMDEEMMIAKKKFAKKLEDYRLRAREMLEEKDKQLLVARSRLKSARNSSHSPMIEQNHFEFAIKSDKETQTQLEQAEESILDGVNENVIIQSTDDLIAALKPPMNATIASQEKDEEVVDDKDADENQMLSAMAQMQMERDYKIREFQDRLRRVQELLNKSEDVKKSADNSEYLKNALLQYFDGKIDLNNLISVVSVGLRFNDEEQKKAKSCKLIEDQAGMIGGYVKSWWS